MIFNPTVRDLSLWRLHKIGEFVDALKVVNNGSKHLHGIDMGVAYNPQQHNQAGSLFIESLDVSLVSPGRRLVEC